MSSHTVKKSQLLSVISSSLGNCLALIVVVAKHLREPKMGRNTTRTLT